MWEGCAGEAVELGRLVSPAGREMLTVRRAETCSHTLTIGVVG